MHACTLVQRDRARRAFGVDAQSGALESAATELGERVAKERLADAPATVRPQNAEYANPAEAVLVFATPADRHSDQLTVGYGGCFGCIYSVRGAGGYQLFGITPMPIYDPQQKISYLREFMVLFRPGDIVKWKPIERAEYDDTVKRVEAGRYDPKMRETTFDLKDFSRDIPAYNHRLEEVLNGR